MRTVRVKSMVDPAKLSGVIIGGLLNDGVVDVQAVGASAINQGLKAIIIAMEKYPLSEEICYCVPRFQNIEAGGDKLTGISILVKKI